MVEDYQAFIDALNYNKLNWPSDRYCVGWDAAIDFVVKLIKETGMDIGK